MPCVAVAETKVSPAGRRSLTRTPVAALGPLFCAVTVNVTFWPTFGVALLTDFVSAMSADWPFRVAEATSLAALGSGWLPPERFAVFVMLPALLTVAVIVSVADAPLVRAPTFQSPLPLL